MRTTKLHSEQLPSDLPSATRDASESLGGDGMTIDQAILSIRPPSFGARLGRRFSVILLALLASCGGQSQTPTYNPKYGKLGNPVFPLVGKTVVPEEFTLSGRLTRQESEIKEVAKFFKPKQIIDAIAELEKRVVEQAKNGKTLPKKNRDELFHSLSEEVKEQFFKYDQIFKKMEDILNLEKGLLRGEKYIVDNPDSYLGKSQVHSEKMNEVLDRMARLAGHEVPEATPAEKALKYPTSERLVREFGTPLDLLKKCFKRITGKDLPNDIEIQLDIEQIDKKEPGVTGRAWTADSKIEVSNGDYLHEFLILAHEIGHLIAPLRPDIEITLEDRELTQSLSLLDKAEETAAFLFTYAIIATIEDPELKEFAFSHYSYEVDSRFVSFCEGYVTLHSRAATYAAVLLSSNSEAITLFNRLVAEPQDVVLEVGPLLRDAKMRYWANLKDASKVKKRFDPDKISKFESDLRKASSRITKKLLEILN